MCECLYQSLHLGPSRIRNHVFSIAGMFSLFLIINCLLGKNFTNITSTSGNCGARDIVPSSSCTEKTTNNVVELVALSEVTALAACRCQPSHLPVLMDWFGDPTGCQDSV